MHKLGELPRYSQHIHTGLTSYHKTFANIAKNIVMGYKKREARIYQSEKKTLEKVSILAYSHFRLLGEDFRKKKYLTDCGKSQCKTSDISREWKMFQLPANKK